MRRYKFENLLMAFLISKQQSYLSIIDGKSEMRRLKFKINLSKQRKKMLSQNLPECAFSLLFC